MQANGLDLKRFQFDYDQSFASLILNADGTIYGRYGSRSGNGEDAARDISIPGLRATLEAALKVHAGYPANRATLAAKTGPTPPHPIPEAFPTLKKFQSKLDYQGKVSQSCIHCHMIRDAERRELRSAGKPLPDKILYPWPMPDVVGLHLDPKTRSTIAKVAAKTPAANAGFLTGDEILAADGQPILSTADLQWVLENTGDSGKINFSVQREGNPVPLTLDLPSGWRHQNDISWRVSSWELRRMALGGLKLESLPPARQSRLGLNGKLALRVEHVGQYGDHAVAKKAGFRKGDLITALDGNSKPMNESQLMVFAVQNHQAGDSIPVTIRRGDRELTLQLKLQ